MGFRLLDSQLKNNFENGFDNRSDCGIVLDGLSN